jgi:hypothetical protein
VFFFNLLKAYIRATCHLIFSSFKKRILSFIQTTYIFKAKFRTSSLVFSATLTQPRVGKWILKLKLISVHIIKTM